jgi:hypothetical protein
MEKKNMVIFFVIGILLIGVLFIVFSGKISNKSEDEYSEVISFGNEMEIVFNFLDEYSDKSLEVGFEISAQVNVDGKLLEVYATGNGNQEELKSVIPETYKSDFGNIPINLIFE